MRVSLAPVLEGRVRAAWLRCEGLQHREHPDFRAAVATLIEELREHWSGQQPASIAQLAAARTLYRAVGMDPTRHRPSSEALLRRILQGKGLYALDPIVDTGNLFSLRSGLPLGLYDCGPIAGAITLRLGESGESYPGIRKGEVNVTARLCLADEIGAFGSPTSDSARCMIRPETRDIFALLYAPADRPLEEVRGAAAELAADFERWNGGMMAECGFLPAT